MRVGKENIMLKLLLVAIISVLVAGSGFASDNTTGTTVDLSSINRENDDRDFITDILVENRSGFEIIPLDLSGWVALARSSSPDVVIAESDLDISQAGLVSSRAFLFPRLSLSASGGRTWSTSTISGLEPENIETDSYSTTLSLSQEILASGGCNWLNLNAQRHSVHAAEHDYRETFLDLDMNVIEYFYDVVEASGLLQAASRSLERSEQQLHRVNARYDMGAATTLEFLQASVRESSDRLLQSQRVQSLRTAYSNLYVTVGIQLKDEILYLINTDAILTPVSFRTASEINLDIDLNPSLLATRERVEQYELLWRAEKRSYWPSISANGRWSWSNDELDFNEWQDNDSWYAGISLTWTIFDGMLREGRISSARSSYLRNTAVLESLENSMTTNVKNLQLVLINSIESYELAQLSLELSEEQFDLARMSYELGATGLVELLDAQVDLADAEASAVSALTGCLLAEARLFTTLGITPRIGE